MPRSSSASGSFRGAIDSGLPPALGRRLGLCDGALWSLLLLSPLAVGTVHVAPWTVALGLALTAFAAALAGTPAPPRAPRIVFVIAGLWGLGVLFHQMPLPEGLVRLLSPQSAAAWDLGPPVSAGGLESPSFRVHRSPGAGAFQVLRWITACAFAAACFLRASDRNWRRRLPSVVLGSVVVAAVVCLVQTAAGSESLLGLYIPRSGFGDLWRSPLINPNHWSAYLSMGGLVGLGLAVRADRDGHRGLSLLCGFAALLLISLVCFSSSRGGLIGLGVGSAAFVLLASAAGRSLPGPSNRRWPLPVAGLLSALLLLASLWGALDRSDSRLDPYSGEQFGGLSEESRVELFPIARAVLADHGTTGVGRDALYDVFPAYRDLQGLALSRWMEVLPVDLFLDFGWVFGGLLLLSLCLMLVLALRAGGRGATRAGAAAALLSLAVHELGDFATEGGAVLFMAIALSSLVLSGRNPQPTGAPQLGASLPTSVSAARRAWLGLLAVCLVLLPLTRGAFLHSDVSRCLSRMSAQSRAGSSWGALGAAEWPNHPSSFPLALGVAFGARTEADVPTALAWLNRAQVLAPHHPGPHLWTARLLRKIGAEDQALVEYRLAMEGAWREGARDIFREVARSYSEEEDLRRLVPADRPESIAQFAMWLRDLGDGRAAAFGLDAIDQLDESPATLMAGIYARIDRKEWELAWGLIEKAWLRDDLDPNIRLRLAVSMGWSGDLARSLAMLRQMETEIVERDWPSYWFSLGREEARAGNAPAARRALRRIGLGASPHWRARALHVEAALAEQDGRAGEAVRLRERAAALDGAASPLQLEQATPSGELSEGPTP